VRRAGISVKDVAELAGVSVGTVSNVLNSPDIVAEQTRARVENAIASLGWSRNESARQLRSGTSKSIGMVVMDIANPFFTDVLGGVEDCVHDHGYSVQLGNSAQLPERESRQLDLVEEQRLRGLLLAPIGDATQHLARFNRRGIPIVVVDRAGGGMDCCSVAVDDVEGGRLAVHHLVQRGHRRIAVVGGQFDLQQVDDRRLGAYLASAGGTLCDLLVLSTPGLDTTSGAAAAAQILAIPAGQRPTATFAVNDLVALGLLQVFLTHGLSVPHDMAIIGYDDIEYAGAAAIPLSSIRQPRRLLGQRAAELLFEEITATDNGGSHEHRHIRFTPELVERRSTAA
jgi:LacI family transcriptional regulator